MDDVPRQAISMSIQQILKVEGNRMLGPRRRKAQAVKDCVERPISNLHPASILVTHPNYQLFLDQDSASLLS